MKPFYECREDENPAPRKKHGARNFLTAAFLLVAAFIGYEGSFQRAWSQATYILQNGTMVLGHLITGGNPPIMTGGTLSLGSTDFAGSFTQTATGTNAVMTFTTAFVGVPICLATDNTTPEGVSTVLQNSGTPSKTSVTFRGATTGDFVSYLCVGIASN